MAFWIKVFSENDDPKLIKKFIGDLEKLCLAEGEQLEVPVINHFSKDVYAREMRMTKGTMIIGKIHRHANLNILSEGEVSVLSEGRGLERLKAPFTFVAEPGAKRLIFAHTDVTWTTIHGTDETDLDKIEKEFIAVDYDDVVYVETKEKLKCLG